MKTALLSHARLAALVRPLATVALAALVSLAPTLARSQVGLRPQVFTAPDGNLGDAAYNALLWYPTAVPGTPQALGPFRFQAALGAPPQPGRHPLVLLSHGTGGHELGHAWLAQGLVTAGYVVVSFRHPADNFQDRSAVGRPDYFTRRPQQASAVLTALLDDPAWAALIDPQRMAVLGHSAGGYTALALAGGRPEVARIVAHCAEGGVGLRDDAAMCALRSPQAGLGPGVRQPVAAVAAGLPASNAATADPRIRAAVAFAPLGVVFTPESLAAVAVPVHVEVGGRDEVLAPALHGLALCRAMPRAECVETAGAGHFAAFQGGTGPLPTAAGDPAFDPAGFDRAAWQPQALQRVLAFLAGALNP